MLDIRKKPVIVALRRIEITKISLILPSIFFNSRTIGYSDKDGAL